MRKIQTTMGHRLWSIEVRVLEPVLYLHRTEGFSNSNQVLRNEALLNFHRRSFQLQNDHSAYLESHLCHH